MKLRSQPLFSRKRTPRRPWHRWLNRQLRSAYVGLAMIACVIVSILPTITVAQPPAHQARLAAPAQLVRVPLGKPPMGPMQPTRIAQLQTQTQTAAVDGQADQQAMRLKQLAQAYQDQGNWDAAQQSLDQALTLLEAPGPVNAIALAQLYSTQGGLKLAMGDAQAAWENWKIAETHYQAIQDEIGIVGSQINQAQALQVLGYYHRAHQLLTRLQGQIAAQTAPELKALQLQSLGVMLQATGDLQDSQALLEESLGLIEQHNLEQNISGTLLNLGNTLRALGQTDAALDRYQQAAAAAATPVAQITAEVNHLSLLIADQRWSAANQLLGQMLDPLTQLPVSRAAIETQVNFVHTLMPWLVQTDRQVPPPQVGQQDLAQILGRAIQHARQLDDPRGESQALGQLGHLYEQNQQWSYAQDLTQQALALAQRSNAADIAYQWQWQLGRVFANQAHRDHQIAAQRPLSGPPIYREQAIAAYRDAIATLSDIRGDLLATRQNVLFSFQDGIEPIYRQFVDLLTQPDAIPTELQQARETIEQLQVAELENYFRSACLDVQPQQIDRIDAKAAVIYPVLLSNRLEVILSLPNQPLRHYSTVLDQATAEQKIQALRSALNPAFPNQLRLQLSQTVYQWLIQPAEADLAASDIETLVFVLDGSLRNIPMAALHDGQHYLIETYDIALTPGLQLLATEALRTEDYQTLIGGLTEARQGFLELPGVSQEVNDIKAQVDANIFLNQDFTQDKLRASISQSKSPIVHLATHGQFSSKADDTFLLAWDNKIKVKDFQAILESRANQGDHPIQLLILSACQTASGDKHAALGLAGMAVRSGARSTLATLWSVKDESTAKLMAKFYEIWTQNPNMTKAKVLRQAQLELLNDPDFEHPFYWAPFVLVGNWL